MSTLVGTSGLILAQEDANEQLSDTVQLSTVSAIAKLPITTEVISKSKIEDKNLGQDMPFLLKNATSVVTTSDAGAGIGYTSMRIRGISNNQVNVTFNGVPVNDSDSHGVFWVDFPDISSSSNGITIQRGVGTSSNGAQAFGASVNLETNKRNKKTFADLMTTYGSFNSQKYMVSAGSGDFANNKFNVDARASYVKSDGYIDRAKSKLFSAALNARYMPNKNTEFHIMNIFGHENTYQAWNGVTQEDIKNYGRTFNGSGAIWGDTGITGFYDNEVDNYDQNHLHAYWKQRWNSNWTSKATLHYTRGIGYYENYKQSRKLAEFRLKDFNQEKADLIRRKYLDNHFYGAILNAEGRFGDDLKFYFGAAANKYIGDHYGKVHDVIDATYSRISDKFYENRSNKTEFSGFVKALERIDNVEFFGDFQFRTIQYDANYVNNGKNEGNDDFLPFDKNYTFYNPKLGINYNLSDGKIYASYGLTHREPTRDDIINNMDNIKPETLHDFELGYQTHSFIDLGINAYYMYYINQLVLTGEIDNVGAFIRSNVGKSYRAGVELDFAKRMLNDKVTFFGNFTYSKNKNIDYKKEINGAIQNLGNTDLSFAPEFITSFGFDVNPVKGLKLNVTNKYVSDQYLNNEENNDLKLNDYFITDFLARYEFSLGKSNAEISLLVNNVFDRMYANNGYDGGVAYLFPQAGTNFLTGIKVSF